MQVQHPGAHAVTERQGISQVLARDRIEQPPYPLAVALQSDPDGVVRGLARPHFLHFVAGIGLPRGTLQGVLGQ